MACSKAEDLINQLIEATLKLLDFGLNIMDALRVQKLLNIRNEKIGLISDEACLPECSLRFSLNFDLMMFNKLLRSACLRARATLNELRVCRLRYPNAPLMLEPKTKVKFQKLQKKIQEFDQAVRSDKMIARRDLRDFREIAIIFSQLEHDLKLLICSLECASTMKDTVLFAAPITDVMTVLSIVLNRLERLAQKAEIDEKIAAVEQQKTLQDQKTIPMTQSNSVTPVSRQPSTKSRTNETLFNGKNTNRTAQQRRQDMTAMIAAASQLNITSNHVHSPDIPSDTTRSLKPRDSIARHPSIPARHMKRHRKKLGRSIENLSDEIPISHRRVKQYRNEFIRKWTDDARQNYSQTINQMTHVTSKKIKRYRHSSKEGEELGNDESNEQSLKSISLTSISPMNHSSNNSAFVHLQSKKSHDNLECKIS